MPKVRTAPINPLITDLMATHGVSRLKDLALKLGVEYEWLRRQADCVNGRGHVHYESLLKNTRALGMTADEFIAKLLDADSNSSHGAA